MSSYGLVCHWFGQWRSSCLGINILIIAHKKEPEFEQGELRQLVRRRFATGTSPITCISASQFSSRIIAVGNTAGYVRLIDLKYGDDADLFDAESELGVGSSPLEETEYKTLFRSRMFPTSVKKVIFDPTGKFLLCVSGQHAFVVEVFSAFKIVGCITFSGELQSATWNYTGFEDDISGVFILTF